MALLVSEWLQHNYLKLQTCEIKFGKFSHALFWDTVSLGVLEMSSLSRREWVNEDRSRVYSCCCELYTKLLVSGFCDLVRLFKLVFE
jgi:hypothetical protein